MESKLKFFMLFFTSQVLLYSAGASNISGLTTSGEAQLSRDFIPWEMKGAAGTKAQERGDMQTLSLMPLVFLIYVDKIVGPIYEAGARAGNNLWEETSYAIEVLGGSQRNRTSDNLKEHLWKDAKASVYFVGGGVGYYDTSYNGKLQGGKLHPEPPCNSFDKPITAVSPEDSCVRLFQNAHCKGPSIAVYPGSKALSSHSQFLSIGRCLRSEFEFSTFYTGPGEGGGTSARKNVSNAKELPDSLMDISGAGYFAHFGSQPQDPSKRSKGSNYYYFEQGGRLKWSGGIVFGYYPHAGNQTTMRLKESKRWTALEKKEGDAVGFAFPPALGGSTKDIKNIFAQSRENLKEWNLVLGDILAEAERLKKNGRGLFEGLELSLTMAYENERTNRPFGFYYYFMFRSADSREFSNNRNIRYGFVRN